MLHVVCAVWPPSTVANVDGEVALTVQPLGAVSVTLTLRRGAVPVFGSCVVAVKVEPGTATTGALRLSATEPTTMTAEPCTPFTVTLIVAVPAAMAWTIPLLLTVATEGLLVL
jgi:hypothetical protein